MVTKLHCHQTKKYVAFVIHDEDSVGGEAYISDISNGTTTNMGYDEYSDKIRWNSDSSYFIIDAGTSVTRIGSIYSVEHLDFITHIGYWGTAFWLDSETIVYEDANEDVIWNNGIEPPFTSDIVTYNIDTGVINKLYEGTTDYKYSLVNVIDNNIEVIKEFDGDSSTDRKTEKLEYIFMN